MTILNSGRFGMAAIASGGIRKIIGKVLIETTLAMLLYTGICSDYMQYIVFCLSPHCDKCDVKR